MNVQLLSEILAFLAASVGAVFGLTQLHRTFKTRSVDGVSAFSWFAMAVNAGLWTVYGVRTGSAQQILANTPWVLTSLVVGALLARSRGLPAVGGILLGLLGLPFGVFVNGFGAAGVTVLGVLLLLGIGVPQILLLRRSVGAEGVSLVGWVLACAAASCWTVHGLLASEPAVYLCSTLGLTLNVLVVAALLGARGRATQLESCSPSRVTGVEPATV